MFFFHGDTTEQNRISLKAVAGQALQYSPKGEFRCQRVEFPNAFPFLHFFISLSLCLFWVGGKGDRASDQLLELKEDIRTSRATTAGKGVSIADDSSLNASPEASRCVSFSKGLYISEVVYEMVAMAVTV